MFSSLFDLNRHRLNLRSTVARDVQAYYDNHAGADANVRKFKWLGAAVLGLFCYAALARNEVLAAGGPDQTDFPIVSPVTVFIDGPTEFVFVYTVKE